MTRDLKGYANHYPDVRWPGGARVAVSVVLNIEEGAELLLSAGDERKSHPRGDPEGRGRARSVPGEPFRMARASATGASASSPPTTACR